MYVIYAEKPDMATKFAAALGGIRSGGKLIDLDMLLKMDNKSQAALRRNGYVETAFNGRTYVVTWGMGHFGELKQFKKYFPEGTKWSEYPLPFFPEEFDLELRGESYKKQFAIVKNLFNSPDCEMILNATDYEREGELIFAYTYKLTGTHKPYMRVRLNEQTQDKIREGFTKLFSEQENNPKVVAAELRAKADWTIGMNLTIAMTVNMANEMLSIGRVLTPTLAMIVAREKAIRDFVKEPTYTNMALFATGEGNYIGKLKDSPIKDKAEAERVKAECVGKNGVITKLEKKAEETKPPRPYDTSSLQLAANKKYKMPLKTIDEIMQSLYNKGFITYPRVDTRFLTEDMEAEMPARISALASIPAYKELLDKGGAKDYTVPKRYFSNKVKAHPAIVTTELLPTGLSEDEKKIYDLVARSTIALCMPNEVKGKTRIETEVGQYTYITTGSILLYAGWSVVKGTDNEEDTEKEGKEPPIPADVSEGLSVAGKYKISEGETKPPLPYTPGELPKAMENCGSKQDDEEAREVLNKIGGLGRPSTRSSIVENLRQKNYITIEKNRIHPTDLGMDIIDKLEIESLKTPEVTVDWEIKLSEIEEWDPDDPSGYTDAADRFMEDVNSKTSLWVGEMKRLGQQGVRVGGGASKGRAAYEDTGLICPSCGRPLHEFSYKTKTGKTGKAYSCNTSRDDRSCGFILFKTQFGKDLTDKQIQQLLKDGRTAWVKGFVSKRTGNEYGAYLYLEKQKDPETGKEKYQVRQTFDSTFECPCCGQHLRPNRTLTGYLCPSCRFGFFTEYNGRKLKKDEVAKLLKDGHTGMLSGFKSKKGNDFSADLAVKDGKVQFVFDEN